jgi:hypothetical protein
MMEGTATTWKMTAFINNMKPNIKMKQVAEVSKRRSDVLSAADLSGASALKTKKMYKKEGYPT